VDAEGAGFVGGSGDDAAAAGFATDDDGLAEERGVACLLDGDEEGIEIDVEYVVCHRSLVVARAF
jgi:hypothetical protein